MKACIAYHACAPPSVFVHLAWSFRMQFKVAVMARRVWKSSWYYRACWVAACSYRGSLAWGSRILAEWCAWNREWCEPYDEWKKLFMHGFYEHLSACMCAVTCSWPLRKLQLMVLGSPDGLWRMSMNISRHWGRGSCGFRKTELKSVSDTVNTSRKHGCMLCGKKALAYRNAMHERIRIGKG